MYQTHQNMDTSTVGLVKGTMTSPLCFSLTAVCAKALNLTAVCMCNAMCF